LIDLRVAATDSSLLKAQVITGDSVIMSAVDLTITSTYGGTYDRAFAFIEYLQEI
jgi:hypothetical protein